MHNYADRISVYWTGIMSANNSSSPIARLIPMMIFFGGLIGLYYLYHYLFGVKTGNSYSLLTATQSAIIDPSKPIIITSDKLPSLFEGGEFTISTWIYVNNWSHRSGFNKSIISVGGPNFDTIRVYLGGNKPKISIRLQTRDQTGAPSSATASQAPSLDSATQNMTFNVLQTDSGLLYSSPICDLREIDLQRWVNLTIAVNGRTVDSYVDGKLARSCVLPSNFKVDAGGYSAKMLAYGGFGGQISTTTMYDAALHPEAVYKNYMAGPIPITTIAGWLISIFEPSISATVSST
jgi:hypothetical protein